jgi:hypothetical protein
VQHGMMLHGRKSQHAADVATLPANEELRQAAVRGDSDTVIRLMGEGIKLDQDDVSKFIIIDELKKKKKGNKYKKHCL